LKNHGDLELIELSASVSAMREFYHHKESTLVRMKMRLRAKVAAAAAFIRMVVKNWL
jgi:hypothetical protein